MARGSKIWYNKKVVNTEALGSAGGFFLSYLQYYSYLKRSHGKSQLVQGTSSGLHLHLLPGEAHDTTRTRPQNR
jgi:hypothetical protein